MSSIQHSTKRKHFTLSGFSPATSFSVGTNPMSVAAADFNGDGKLDLVTANYGAVGTVSVLPGNGAGSFGAANPFSVGSLPRSVVAADFNGDGKLDLVTANSPNTVSVLLGNGAGSFGAASSFTVGSYPYSVAAADFNGDSKIDLVTANYGVGTGTTVSVLLGNGAGSFGAASTFTSGYGTVSVAAADFNGDSKIDLVTANYGVGANTVSVLLGNGTGSFGAANPFTVGTRPYSLAAADFNGDGKLDLVTTNKGGGSGTTVSVLLGNGAGNFGTAGNFTVGTDPNSVAVADFNGDGKTDLVTANYGGSSGNTVSVLLGNGAGSFGAASPFTVGTGPYSVATADFNGDSIPDLVTANYNNNTVSVLLGTISVPTTSPTIKPTKSPTRQPTLVPTTVPTTSYPTTSNPTTMRPTAHPTLVPTSSPSLSPTRQPTLRPTKAPTAPTTPSPTPSFPTTSQPTTPSPTEQPTFVPTIAPSLSPTISPTDQPTLTPTSPAPTFVPTLSPSLSPTLDPSTAPTFAPTLSPSLSPTLSPSPAPTFVPTLAPSVPLGPVVMPIAAPYFISTNPVGVAFIDLRNSISDASEAVEQLRIMLTTQPSFGTLYDLNFNLISIGQLSSPGGLEYVLTNSATTIDSFSYVAVDTNGTVSFPSNVTVNIVPLTITRAPTTLAPSIAPTNTAPTSIAPTLAPNTTAAPVVSPAPTTAQSPTEMPTAVLTAPLTFNLLSSTNGNGYVFLDFRNYIYDSADIAERNMNVEFYTLPSFGTLYAGNVTAAARTPYRPDDFKYVLLDPSQSSDQFQFTAVGATGLTSTTPGQGTVVIKKQSNIILNPGFDGGLAAWTTQNAGSASFSVIIGNATSMLQMSRNSNNDLCLLTQTLSTPVINRPNTFQLSYKTSDASLLQYDIMDNSLISSTSSYKHQITLIPDNTWHTTTLVTFMVNNNENQVDSTIGIKFGATGTGSVCLEDITLSLGDPVIPQPASSGLPIQTIIKVASSVGSAAITIGGIALKSYRYYKPTVLGHNHYYSFVSSVIPKVIMKTTANIIKSAETRIATVLALKAQLAEINTVSVQSQLQIAMAKAVDSCNQAMARSEMMMKSAEAALSVAKGNAAIAAQAAYDMAQQAFELYSKTYEEYSKALGASSNSGTELTEMTPIGIALGQYKIDLISLNASTVSFDYTDNGVKARTAWVGAKDAFLIYDHNDNHKVDAAKELVLTQWSSTAKTDFIALKEVFDSNKDNKFDAKDAEFNRFHLWQDKNQDGISQSNELASLPEAGLVRIDFDTEQTVLDEFFDKPQAMQVAGVLWADGHQTLSYDLVLECNAKQLN